jgi:hypothetical protein
MVQGTVGWSRAVSTHARSYTQKNICWAPQRGFGDAPKINFCRLTIHLGAHFSASNTEFEGGGDGHGYDAAITLFWSNKTFDYGLVTFLGRVC